MSPLSARRRRAVSTRPTLETIQEESDTEKINQTAKSNEVSGKKRSTAALKSQKLEEWYWPFSFLVFSVGLLLWLFIDDPEWKMTVTGFLELEINRALPVSQSWWSNALIYQIYPRSFYDSDGDGVGDLSGIKKKLVYLEHLGVDAICLYPIFKSPLLEHGYDVTSFTEIDPALGTKEDLQKLVMDAHARDIRVILDFVPGHLWFGESPRGGATDSYSDCYVRQDGFVQAKGSRSPSHSRMSVRDGPMWQWNKRRKQCHLHQCRQQEPNLNARSNRGWEKILDSMGVWIDLGVDGFRLSAERLSREGATLTDSECYHHKNTANPLELKSSLRQWRKMLDQYEKRHNSKLVLMTDVGGRSIGTVESHPDSSADLAIDFSLQRVNTSCCGVCMARLTSQRLERLAAEQQPSWLTGSPDVSRVASSLGNDYVNIMNAIVVLLPGVSFTYYGEELGMRDVDGRPPLVSDEGEQELDVGYETSQAASPMQWSADRHAGFIEDPSSFDGNPTKSDPWRAVHPQYEEINVAVQGSHEHSHLGFYRKVAALRRQPSIRRADFELGLVNQKIFSFIRFATGEPGYLFTVNLSNDSSTDNHMTHDGKFPRAGQFIPREGAVVFDTLPPGAASYQAEDRVDLSKLQLVPKEGLLIKFWPGY